MMESMVTRMLSCYSETERAAVYRVIRERRDVRTGYLRKALDDTTLIRLLGAAHCAPSVGLMQPWRFIVVRNTELRTAVYDNFLRANAEAAASYSGDRRAAYGRLRLEGLLEAPQHLCVVCDTTSMRGLGLGRNSMPETATHSVVCAVQNLWLAARSEGIGVGWVSIIDPFALKELLQIPPHVELVAYLCLGYVESFSDLPDLEREGWERREELTSLVNADYYDRPYSFAEAQR